MTATILVSRFRDSLTPGALPLADESDSESRADAQAGEPDYYTLHIADTGHVITYRWIWVTGMESWVQCSPLFAEDVETARDNVPPTGKRVPMSERCPCSEAFEIYEVLA